MIADIFFSWVLPVVVAVGLIVQLRKVFAIRDRRLPLELTFPEREELCGGTLDFVHVYTKPALRLSLYKKSLVIKGYQHDLALDYEDITSAEVTHGLLGSRVTIRHRRQEITADIHLYCDDNRAIAAAIRAKLELPDPLPIDAGATS